jgi:hypothetical protein
MPYIEIKDRSQLDATGKVLRADNAGQLNFQITQLVRDFLRGGPESYARYNAAIGALECAKLELYRRKIQQYEDSKILENGDVYHG